MRIAFIGLGKLGFPCAVACALKGHEVYGYDLDSALVDGYRRGQVTPFEPGLEEQYASCRQRMHYCDSADEAIAHADYVFVSVPTPHAPRHDGSFPYDGVARDFDHSIIRSALEECGRAIGRHARDGRFRTLLVISTTTPGTMVEDLGPATVRAVGRPIGDGWTMVYNPFFIGQSTVVRDFLHPEFVLLGVPQDDQGRVADAGEGERLARTLYGSLHAQPICPMTWTEAECVKLCYNTYLGLKVAFANTVMELCHKLPGADCDVVNATLKLAKDRLVSPKYMDGGMADGGPCHGRDQMAMSYVAQKVGLTFNMFDLINHGRDAQTGWLADLIAQHARGREVVLLGMAFKPGTNQTQGSPAILLANILRERGIDPVLHDPVIHPHTEFPAAPALYFISTRWAEYRGFKFRKGDTVVDPWRMLRSVPAGVELISVGQPTTSPAPAQSHATDVLGRTEAKPVPSLRAAS
jgi:UDPglucose 6-dehydrogenase